MKELSELFPPDKRAVNIIIIIIIGKPLFLKTCMIKALNMVNQ